MLLSPSRRRGWRWSFGWSKYGGLKVAMEAWKNDLKLGGL